ncbi:MAG: hypothetical protein E6593_07585 [Clostridium sp.]|nr:hypothetical protein [Clostridium sp.]
MIWKQRLSILRIAALGGSVEKHIKKQSILMDGLFWVNYMGLGWRDTSPRPAVKPSFSCFLTAPLSLSLFLGFLPGITNKKSSLF